MNELQVVDDKPPDLSPRNFNELMEFADTLANSNLVPKDYIGKRDNIIVAMQWGSELGLKPMQSLQNIAVIGNRPSIWGDAMLALVLASPVCKDVIEYFEGDGESLTAVCIAQRHGRGDKKATFSLADARTAELVNKDVWKKYPPRMLQMRARGFALRDQFADVLRGMPMAELVIEQARNMGPVDEVPRSTPEPASGSRTDAVKQKLKKQQLPTLADVLKEIDDAQDAAAMRKAGDRAAQLIDETEKVQARERWQHKLETSRSPKAPAQDGTAPNPVVTYAEVADAIRNATNRDDRAAAADLIRHIPSEEQRVELGELYELVAREQGDLP
ncbi:hypothetical protein [Paraburkholderia caribensis]|uniref:hypothetical protein n=1 Tax=Paraburkholderia caribensis TaxID=75105 RepID=UPI002866AD1B|nr:hypothetical protein [Paraburkholderia caribensis]MDR6384960.1 hypothetical protein [Paraburkholderia caribensis]